MLFFVGCGSPSLTLTDLSSDDLKNSLGIDAKNPRLSCQLESNQRGQKQTAYHTLVASSPRKLAKEVGDL